MLLKTVLVTEKHPEFRRLLCLALTHYGYRTLEAEDGHAAVEMARSRRPDLILMDLAVPARNDLAAARLLHEDPEIRHIPILAVFGHPDAVLDTDGQRTRGISRTLHKPFTVDELLGAVRRVLPEGAA